MSTLKNSMHIRMIIRKQVFQIIKDDFTTQRIDRGLTPLSEKQIRDFIINNLNDIERIIWNISRYYCNEKVEENEEPKGEWITKYWTELI